MLSISAFLFSVSSSNKFCGVLAFFILIFYYFKVRRVGSSLRVALCFSVFVLFLVSFSTLLHNNYYHYYFYFLFFVSYFILLSVVVLSHSEDEVNAFVNYYLFIHLASFYVQLSCYYAFDYYIDFYTLLSGGKEGHSAYLAKELEGSLIKLRPGGFFSEPSFFAMAILPFFCFKLLVGKFKNLLFALTLLALYLNFSIASLIVTSLIFFVHSARVVFLNRSGYLFVFLCMFLVGSMFLVGYDFLYARIFDGKTYDPVGYRLSIFNEFSERDSIYNFLGVGFFLDEFGVNGSIGLSPAQIRDSGFFVSLFYFSGVIGVVLFGLHFFLLSRFSGYVFIVFFCALLMKYSFLVPGFWLLCVLCLKSGGLLRRGRIKNFNIR